MNEFDFRGLHKNIKLEVDGKPVGECIRPGITHAQRDGQPENNAFDPSLVEEA